MASVRVEPAMSGAIGSSSMFHAGSSGVDQLPKELLDMKLHDDRGDDVEDDKVFKTVLLQIRLIDGSVTLVIWWSLVP